MQRDKTAHERIREALLSCRVCDLQPVCLPWDMEPEERRLLDRIVEHPRPLQKGEYLYRAGDALQGIYALRSGIFKSLQADGAGNRRILGFGLPGELLGVDGVYSQRHTSDAVALMESAVCVLPYQQLAALLGSSERLRELILRLASMGNAPSMREGSAERRVANFLLDLTLRCEAHGNAPTHSAFPIPDSDIAAHLQLDIREVTRIFAHFQGEGLIARDKGNLGVRDAQSLGRIANRD
jgi:CRP/FNR family transcriptional regulator, anaerobic regulatory protein